MGIVFDQAYFDGTSKYSDRLHFAVRADWLITRYGVRARLAEVGAAKGYVIKHLRRRGMSQAVGYDSSEYAVSADPDCAGFVRLADAGKADLSGHDLIVSWNMLDCLADDDDAARVVSNLVASGVPEQIHVVCTDDDVDAESYRREGYLIRPITFWMDLFSSDGVMLIEYRSCEVWKRSGGSWSTVSGLSVPLSGERVSL